MHADRPSLVVRCTGTADVVEAVNFARENGIEVTVRGGGHSVAGLSSTDGGMLVDLSLMRAVDVDPDARLARVQGGAVLGDVDRETPAGGARDAARSGLGDGGRWPDPRRRLRLAAWEVRPRVRQPRLGASRRRRRPGAHRLGSVNPDLFWALRGGGGNFGIVTSFTFRLHEVGPIVAFAGVFYRLEDGVEVYRRLREFTKDLPDEISIEAISVASEFPADPHLPEPLHNQRAVIIGSVYTGDPDEGMKALQPLQGVRYAARRHLATDAVHGRTERLRRLPPAWGAEGLLEVAVPAQLPPTRRSRRYIRVARERPSGSPFEFVYADIYPMRGAMTRVGAEDTSFGERAHPWMLAADSANWTDDAEHRRRDRVGRGGSSASSSGGGTGTQYLNFTALVGRAGRQGRRRRARPEPQAGWSR